MNSYKTAFLHSFGRKRWLVLITVFVFLLPGSSIVAQEVQLGFQWGKGAYSMEHLKYYELRLSSQMPDGKQKVVDYPPFWFYQPAVSVSWNRISLGLALGVHSTGSRYSLIDYSGEYRFDSRIMGRTLGAVFKFKINPSHPVHVSLYSEAGLIFTRLNMKEYFVVDEQILINESIDSRSFNYYMEPGLEISCPVYLFVVAVQAGSCVQFGGNGLHGSNEEEEYEFSDNKGPVIPEWKGYRISGSLFFNLSRLFTAMKKKDHGKIE